MKRACMGGCKTRNTRDFTSETVVHPTFGWIFIMHDTIECPDRVKWRMSALRKAAQALQQKGTT